MEKTMLAAVQTAKRVMELREVARPEPGAGELLIRVRHVGVCGSDLHRFTRDLPEYGCDESYFILGHEAAGEVAGIGPGVTGFSIGDRVALEPGSTCGRCEYCKAGLYNLCRSVRFLAVPHQRQGVLSQYATHPADLCFKLPDALSTLQGALIEPLSVGLHAANLGDARIGMDAVVFGAGCIGQMVLLALKARGVSRVAVLDVVDIRLQKARQMGADRTIHTGREDAREAIREWTDGRMVDIVFDASGNPQAIAGTLELVRAAGTIVLVGNPSGPMPERFDLLDFVNREITMKGVFRYRNSYPMAIRAVAAGLPVQEIPDRVYRFEDAQRAFDDSVDHKAEIVKAVIEL